MPPTAAPPPAAIHGIPVLTRAEAKDQGFLSVTNIINASTEAAILAGVCQHRDPIRCRLIHHSGNYYTLALYREDVSGDIEGDAPSS